MRILAYSDLKFIRLFFFCRRSCQQLLRNACSLTGHTSQILALDCVLLAQSAPRAGAGCCGGGGEERGGQLPAAGQPGASAAPRHGGRPHHQPGRDDRRCAAGGAVQARPGHEMEPIEEQEGARGPPAGEAFTVICLAALLVTLSPASASIKCRAEVARFRLVFSLGGELCRSIVGRSASWTLLRQRCGSMDDLAGQNLPRRHLFMLC